MIRGLKVPFPGEIEVDLAQVCIRIADCPACTVYGEVLVVQRQVAEPGHQHANEEKAQSEGQDGRNESPPCIDADGIVAQYQEHKE